MTGSDVPRPRPSAVVPAVLVVLVELALVAAWLAFVLHDEGWSRVVWVGIGLLLFWRMLPRPSRLGPRTRTVTADDAPRLHRLVAEVADAVGVRPPSRVAVDTTYPVTAHALGYLGRTTLVVGLPQWLVLDADGRVAALAHELRCAEARRGPAGCLVRFADDLLTSLRTMLVPTSVASADEKAVQQLTSEWGEVGGGVGGFVAGGKLAREATEAVGGAGLELVGAPVRLVQETLRRLRLPAELAAAREADRAAAALAGPDAVAALVATTTGVPVGLSAAANAARSRAGEDPFAALVSRRLGPCDVSERLADAGSERPDAAHPSVAERLETAGSGRPSDTRIDPGLVAGAEREVEALRPALVGQLREELVHGRP